ELDHLDRLAGGIEHRVVGRLDPDFLAALAEALELGRLALAGGELAPELGVIGAVAIGRVDEHAVVPADDLVEPVAHGAEEILVGGEDGAVEVELDVRLYPVDRSE